MADAKVKVPSSPPASPEALLELYASRLRQYLSRRVRRPEDARDLLQETYARFLRKKDRAEVIRDPFSYLIGIARNVLRDSLADEQHNPILFDSELTDTLAASVSDQSQEFFADRVGERQDIIDALSKLPENHLLAIMLVDGKGMSYEEAAEASGFTKATIATYVMHARATLRQILPDYWSESST